jgi:hypothetical protein
MAGQGLRSDVDVDRLWDDFHGVVNMTSRELQEWLQTTASGPGTEALPDQAGPETGRRVVEILGKRRTDLTDADVEVMQHVVELVRSQHPDPDTGDHDDAGWRHRLMTVGHDPLKPAR